MSSTTTGTRLLALALCTVIAACGDSKETDHSPQVLGGPVVGDIRGVHDPAAAEEHQTFYLFCTGKGIPLRTSTDLRHWHLIGSVFTDLPAWTDSIAPGVDSPWAPDISYFNARWHLYYAISTFGTNRSAIGLATRATLDPVAPDEWSDEGMVIESHSTSLYNAIDPNVAFDQDGTPWLFFGSFWRGIFAVQLDPMSGKLRDGAQPMLVATRLPFHIAIEAPFVVHHDDYYYLFVSFDFCCRGVDSDYRVMVARSHEITGPFVDAAGKSMNPGGGGGSPVIASYDNVRGPGHNAVLRSPDGRYWFIHHYYDANADGTPTLEVRPLSWSEDGWPVVPQGGFAGTENGLEPPMARMHTDTDK